jgi:hypothetical protein
MSRGRGRRRPGGPRRWRSTSPAGHSGAAAGRRRHGVDRLARRLLRQARAGNPRPLRRRRRGVRQGRVVERRPHLLPRQEVYNFNLVPEPDHHRPGMVNLQQYYLEEYLGARAAALPRDRPALANKVVSVTPRAARASRCKVETARRHLHGRGRLADRRRRRAQPDPAHARPGSRGQDLHGPLPDRRRGDEGGLSRPSAGSGSTRPSIPTSRCCCTSRPTACSASTSSSAGTPTRRGEEAGKRDPAHQGHARH